MMSSLTADGFGIKADDNIGCVGEDVQLFKKCILDIYGSEKMWKKVQRNSLDFICKTHNRKDVTKIWERSIEDNLNKIKEIRVEGDSEKMQHKILTAEIKFPKKSCPEGEQFYARKYPEITDGLKAGLFKTYFEHYKIHGKKEGRNYFCYSEAKS